MKNNWETKTLGEVCDVVTGSTPKTSNKKFYGDFMMWAGPADLDLDFYIVDTKKKLSQEGVVKGGVRVVPKNSVLMSCIGYIGKLGIAAEDMATNQQINTFIPDNKILDSKFLFYQLKTKTEDFKKRSSKATLAIINKTKCSEVSIEFPELSEQKRIVGILDEKFKAIEELKKVTEAQIQDAKELFESRLNIIFGMNEENILPLSDVCKITSSKRVYKADYVKSGVPFYRTKEIKELAHNKQPTTELFIKRDSFDEITSKFGKPEAGDLMLTAIGTIGEIYIVEDKDEFYFKDGNILWLKNIKGVTVGYLRYALNFFVKEIQSLAVGSAYKALTIEKLNNHKIPVPKKEIQNDTVKELDELSIKTQELMEVFQNKIINLEELKKSYLEQAFAGKL